MFIVKKSGDISGQSTDDLKLVAKFPCSSYITKFGFHLEIVKISTVHSDPERKNIFWTAPTEPVEI